MVSNQIEYEAAKIAPCGTKVGWVCDSAGRGRENVNIFPGWGLTLSDIKMKTFREWVLFLVPGRPSEDREQLDEDVHRMRFICCSGGALRKTQKNKDSQP